MIKTDIKKDIQAAYHRSAQTYADSAVIYQEIGGRLISRLDYMQCDPKVILDAGCGLGNFSQELTLRYPKAQVIGLDFAKAMIQNSSVKNMQWILGDMEKLPLQPESVDMIFANQSIQDVADTVSLFRAFHRVLKPGGVLLFSCLGPDTLKELKAAWACVDTYGHVNEPKDLHTLGDELLSNQFLQPVMDMETITVNYRHPKTLLKDLKAQGSYNGHPLRRRGLMGQDAMEYLINGIEKQRQENGKIPLTYEVIYGHAWRGEKKPFHNAETGETFISLDMVRRR